MGDCVFDGRLAGKDLSCPDHEMDVQRRQVHSIASSARRPPRYVPVPAAERDRSTSLARGEIKPVSFQPLRLFSCR